MYFKKLNNGSEDQYVGEANVVAPFSTIQNRAKVEANCKVVGPVERIRTNSLKEVPNEFGPNGEKVYTSDKEDSRIRFVGGTWVTAFTSSGQRPNIISGTTDEFIEVTFYGTGLNVLESNGVSRGLVASIDGGTEGSNILPDTSGVLSARNYNPNIPYPIASGLSLGWHTVKLRKTASGYSLQIYGFEILNESPDLSILSGSVYKNGYEYILENDTTLPMIPTSYSGSNGGRALTYIDPSDGVVKQAINEVGTPAYLGATDHSNEAIYRKINFREFGRNRADDFSTLTSSSSDRAFTLDDGTTTLVGDDVRTGFSGVADTLSSVANGDFWALTFVGTGLDLEVLNDGSGRACIVYVDGVNVGILDPNTLNGVGIVQVCSNLSYSTHTVKVERAGGSISWGVSDFIIYQTKKPVLPKEAFILADYNINADFVPNTNSVQEAVSTGTIKKSNMREFIYSGTWAIGTISPTQDGVTGFRTQTFTNGDYFEYTFFGTGFDFRFTDYSNNTTDATVELNGTTLTSTNFPTATFNTYGTGSVSYNSTTASLNQAGTGTLDQSGFSVSDLPLGLYTIRVTNNNSPNYLRLNSFEIATPIHSPNTSIGNLSMSDMREFGQTKKVNILFDQVGNSVQYSNGVAQVIDRGTGSSAVYFEDSYANRLEFLDTIVSNAEINLAVSKSNTFRTLGSSAFTTRNDAGAAVDVDTIRVSVLDGKKQKDVFKD